MRIYVTFPTVMKIEFKAEIDIEDSSKLSEIHKKVYEIFWETMSLHSPIGEHGDPSQVILKDHNHLEITNDTQLKERLAECKNFEVTFRDHASNKPKSHPPDDTASILKFED
jgi:hypothetical protein